MQTYLVIYLFLMNVVGLLAMKIDKNRAIKGKWRTKEKTFLVIALAGGSFGIYIGLHAFRHKTKHITFKYGIPLIILVQFFLFVYF
ncbi:DUF1294 domain-containing protein [Proteinivorax tanatarense]|uniref:DUF1294 domain-containing protein n=1 Tax=Proteinivorax tanatarense TaxID=1260629 RepID=A0AAU7VMJ8_9FIRM